MAKIFTSNNDPTTPKIDEEKIKFFFSERAKKLKNDSISYKQAIIYQDKNKDLAEARDSAEKKILLPKLKLSKEDRFLDIGCGTGRWTELVANSVGIYHGTDFILDFITEAAKKNSCAHIKFSNLPCTKISLSALKEETPFNKIICLGVLMYLNDSDVLKAMKSIVSVSDKKCTLLLREPVGISNRLTIKEHFSEDMNQFYNAIYRTEDELKSMCNSILKPAGFKLIECEDVFRVAELNNRIETKQKYFIFDRT